MQQATSDAGNPRMLSTRIAQDARAEGGRRTVVLDPDFVIISRRVNGMRMHLSVPIDHYDGVAIAGNGQLEGALYRIWLVHPDPELCVTLNESRDRPFILDAWAEWAAFFAAPALVEDADGSPETARTAGSGAGLPPPAKPRSRTWEKSTAKNTAKSVGNSSPRPFLRSRARSRSNRKSDRGGHLGPVIRGEREIVSYE